MGKREGLPKGIRRRGRTFVVDVFVKGVGRRTRSCSSLDQAVIQQQQLRADMLALKAQGMTLVEADLVASGHEKQIGRWTLRHALKFTSKLPAKAGWKGSKSEKGLIQTAQLVADYFGEDRKLDTITTLHIDEFREDMLGLGNKPGTVNRKVAALSKMMTVAGRRGGLTSKPVFPESLTESRGRIRQVSTEEEERLLNLLCQLGKHDHIDATLGLIETGARISELLSIEVRDCRLTKTATAEPHVILYGRDGQGLKNSDEWRAIPLSQRALAILKRRVAGRKPNERVFPHSYDWFKDQWDRCRKHLGFAHDPQWVPHVLRHTFGCRLAQAGARREVIQQLMGHRTEAMTKRYARLDDLNLSEAIGLLNVKPEPEPPKGGKKAPVTSIERVPNRPKVG